MKRVILTLCAICASSALWAATAVVNGINLTYSVSSGKATITDCGLGASGTLVIPSPLHGYLVTSIGDSAFRSCSGLTSVTIPSSVTSIGDSAFYGCSGLTSVTIPSSVTSIGEYAFVGCTGLTSITIPSSVTSIGRGAFYGCSGLITFTIPEGVTSIESAVFRNCSSLTSITIPSRVTSIGNEAFFNCVALTSITIPSSVTSIGSSAFILCSALISIDFQGPPPSIIGEYEFPEATGSYLPEYVSEWDAVIFEGSWRGLTMNVASFDVSLLTVGNGTVVGAGSQRWNESVTVTATAQEGWVFCGWNTDPITPDATYTFTMPGRDVTLTAYFAPEKAIQQYITTNGLISPDQIGEIAMKAPVIGVQDGMVKLSLKLMKATTLTGNVWEEVALKDSESAIADGQLSVELEPEEDEKTAFYKFVVPNESDDEE